MRSFFLNLWTFVSFFALTAGRDPAGEKAPAFVVTVPLFIRVGHINCFTDRPEISLPVSKKAKSTPPEIRKSPIFQNHHLEVVWADLSLRKQVGNPGRDRDNFDNCGPPTVAGSTALRAPTRSPTKERSLSPLLSQIEQSPFFLTDALDGYLTLRTQDLDQTLRACRLEGLGDFQRSIFSCSKRSIIWEARGV